MMPAMDQLLAASRDHIPHYSHIQEVIGSAVLVTILVVSVGAVIFIRGRRGH
jgi:hypothetical protein